MVLLLEPAEEVVAQEEARQRVDGSGLVLARVLQGDGGLLSQCGQELELGRRVRVTALRADGQDAQDALVHEQGHRQERADGPGTVFDLDVVKEDRTLLERDPAQQRSLLGSGGRLAGQGHEGAELVLTPRIGLERKHAEVVHGEEAADLTLHCGHHPHRVHRRQELSRRGMEHAQLGFARVEGTSQGAPTP